MHVVCEILQNTNTLSFLFAKEVDLVYGLAWCTGHSKNIWAFE